MMNKKDLFYEVQLGKLKDVIEKAIKDIGIDKTLDTEATELAYVCTDALFDYSEHKLDDEE